MPQERYGIRVTLVTEEVVRLIAPLAACDEQDDNSGADAIA